MTIRGVLIPLAVVLAGCVGQPGSPSASLEPTGRSTPLVVSPSLPASTPATTASDMRSLIPLPSAGKIAFSRVDTSIVDGPRRGFTIDPDGSHERPVGIGDVGCGVWSPDGRTVLCAVWDERVGGRPATANPDGSDFRILDAYPGRIHDLGCGSWIGDGSRFVCGSSWEKNARPADNGLYTMRASDGGDLQRVTATPSGCGESAATASVDGAHLIFVRVCGTDDEGTLYRVNLDGRDLIRLSPNEVSVEGGDLGSPADWSPDGSMVAFAAFVPSADSSALYVANADGTGLRRIVSTDVGAVTAMWSPDGQWIAFTSRYRSHAQVWLTHPDGSSMRRLTDGADGTDSVDPVWSPDGTRLLFENFKDGTDEGQSLWTTNTDGTGRTHVADITGSGGYGWGIALAR